MELKLKLIKNLIRWGVTVSTLVFVMLTGRAQDFVEIASFSEDFNGDNGKFNELISLHGNARHHKQVVKITESRTSQNGSMLIQDFAEGASFSSFEMSFRLFMGSGSSRPADGFSVSIGNELPERVEFAEEGAGDGMRICFDAWDSGQDDLAPQIEVLYAGESLASQSFGGPTDVPAADWFKEEDGKDVMMWHNREWADVKIRVFGGKLSLQFRGHTIFDNKPISPGTFKAPQWLFAASTGGAYQKHYIDDLKITLYESIVPTVSSFSGSPGGFGIKMTDSKLNGVDLDSVKVKFDGEFVDVHKAKMDGITDIKYSTDAPLEAASKHVVELFYSDEKGNSKNVPFEYTVSNYKSVGGAMRVDESLKGRRGFLVYSTQISGYQTGSGGLHGNSWANAEKQIRGGYIDSFTNEPYLNEVDPDAFVGWSYYPVIVEMVNQNLAAPTGAGNFNTGNGLEDEKIPGIPGWGGSNDGIACEYLALLQLDRGVYTLGVNSDDGFSAAFCANFSDVLAQQVGYFDGARGSSDSLFEFFVEKPGLYPFRVSWWSNDGNANIELFSVIPGVGKTLINDPDVEGSIKAYTVKGIIPELSTKDRPTTGRTSVVSLFPGNAGKLIKTASVLGIIEVIVQNEDTFVKEDTIQLSLDGEEVKPSVEKSGDTVVITYESDSRFSAGKHTASFSYEESNGAVRSNVWNFEVSKLYSQGVKPGIAEGLTVFEYHGIPSGSVGTLLGNEKYPESPDVTEVAKYFEWPQTGTIKRKPRANYRDNYGWLILGYIHPPETGEYVFHIATDDNSELWLSTDESPANAVKIAQESQWQGVRNFQAEGDESVSAPVPLEAGKAYFVEMVVKEGGVGDNSAVAWRLAGEKDLRSGALPIAGEYLSQWFVDEVDPSISMIRNSDGTVTLTFEGTLQTAPTANGPWRDSKQKSPYKVKANKAVFFGRAKK
ncbi:MAG: PA14 domain-containing protein [Limisphaerales bacterium]